MNHTKLGVPHFDPTLKTSSRGLSVFSAHQDGLVMLYPECLEYDIGKDGLVMGTVTQYHTVPNMSPSPKQLQQFRDTSNNFEVTCVAPIPSKTDQITWVASVPRCCKMSQDVPKLTDIFCTVLIQLAVQPIFGETLRILNGLLQSLARHVFTTMELDIDDVYLPLWLMLLLVSSWSSSFLYSSITY